MHTSGQKKKENGTVFHVKKTTTTFALVAYERRWYAYEYPARRDVTVGGDQGVGWLRAVATLYGMPLQ